MFVNHFSEFNWILIRLATDMASTNYFGETILKVDGMEENFPGEAKEN